MKNLKKVLALSLSLSLALPLAACGDQGETGKGGGSTGSYPSSTITVVCPWDAGGTSDGLCRIVSEIGARDEYFGVNMVVQNSGGAGGAVATLQPFVREVSYTIDDFIPVAALSNEPIIMIAGKDSGITSVDDLLEMDSVTYGFSGSGSLMELSQKQFFGMAGVEATGISYDGSSPTIAALLGGHIDVCTGHPGEVMQYVESGDAVAIGIFNDERDPRENLKDIPTFKEMGYDVTMSVWKFLMLPAGTPEDVVTKVTETLTAITGTDEYKEFCDANQLLPLTMITEEMVERINEEAAVNQELLAG